MPDQKIVAAEDGTINTCAYVWFDHTFDHWNASDGNTYADGATIQANTYAVGDTITLTAVFTQNEHLSSITDGIMDFTIHAGETAVFDDLPAGTGYQVWEETDSGWTLIEQHDSSGTIVPLSTADVTFVNEYTVGTASLTIVGSKMMDGKPADAGAFQFQLLEDDVVIQTVYNEDGGFVRFEPIVYSETGTHTYKICEVAGENDMIAFDSHEETITVEVTEDGGNLVVTATYDDDGAVFTNTTKPGSLTITKTAGGVDDESSVFTFVIELYNDDGLPVTNEDVTWYVRAAEAVEVLDSP